jgi:hypothetical protein
LPEIIFHKGAKIPQERREVKPADANKTRVFNRFMNVINIAGSLLKNIYF